LTRFIFRDCFITSDIRKLAIKDEIQLTELKTENAIDRIKGTVNQNMGGLRTSERVCSGVKFQFGISMRNFDEAEKKLMKSLLELGLALLQLDALGGQVSRGYGKITFIVKDKEGKLKKWDVSTQKLKELSDAVKNNLDKWVEAKKGELKKL
jgi:CRISPR-associated protein Csm3